MQLLQLHVAHHCYIGHLRYQGHLKGKPKPLLYKEEWTIWNWTRVVTVRRERPQTECHQMSYSYMYIVHRQIVPAYPGITANARYAELE